jgi:hypothetical protein
MGMEDLHSIVEIDARVFGITRLEYYESKVAAALDPSRTMITSLVATYEDRVIGFLMGELYHPNTVSRLGKASTLNARSSNCLVLW